MRPIRKIYASLFVAHLDGFVNSLLMGFISTPIKNASQTPFENGREDERKFAEAVPGCRDREKT